MEITSYLNRIQYFDNTSPTIHTLRALQRSHMLVVPFENLDIELKRPIKIDEVSIWDKLINQRRGGFCYELNGLFAWLLKQIGFDVTYLNARVFRNNESPGIEFGHLALLVQVPGQTERWLTDVGFGDSFIEPLQFDEPGEQIQGLQAYRMEQTPDGYVVWQRNYDGSWERQYMFDLQSHTFPEEYEPACLYHQTSPDSSFTRGNIISRATKDGRVSLEDGQLIITNNGIREKRPVASKNEYKTLLKKYFGVIL